MTETERQQLQLTALTFFVFVNENHTVTRLPVTTKSEYWFI